MPKKPIGRTSIAGKNPRARIKYISKYIKLHSEGISKHERVIDVLRSSAAQGTRKAASHSRSVSNIHVFVVDGKLVQQQDGEVTVLKRLKTEKMEVGTRFNLSNARNANGRKKQKIESVRWS